MWWGGVGGGAGDKSILFALNIFALGSNAVKYTKKKCLASIETK